MHGGHWVRDVIVHRKNITSSSARAQKGGFFGVAASQNIAILFPDTSPRGAGVPGEDDDWDFGTGAGFYLDATKPAYSKHYNMATYITVELPHVLEAAGIPIVCLVKPKFYPQTLKDLIGFQPTINLWP